MGYCLYRPQPFEAGPGAESVRSVADSCWSRIKGRDKVELKLGCGNYDPQTPPSTLDSISLKDYPDRLLGGSAVGRPFLHRLIPAYSFPAGIAKHLAPILHACSFLGQVTQQGNVSGQAIFITAC